MSDADAVGVLIGSVVALIANLAALRVAARVARRTVWVWACPAVWSAGYLASAAVTLSGGHTWTPPPIIVFLLGPWTVIPVSHLLLQRGRDRTSATVIETLSEALSEPKGTGLTAE